MTVSDRAALNACVSFLSNHRVLVEPACAAALTPVYQQSANLKDFDKIMVIVCGGSGVSPELLRQWDELLPR